MKVKQGISYHLHVFLRSSVVFYGIESFVYIMLGILSAIFLSGDMSSNGMESATFIFVFIMGLNAFKSQFRMFLQNGLSRKTLLMSFAISALALAIGTTMINQLLSWVFSFFMDCQPTFNDLYRYESGNAVTLTGLTWTASMSLVLTCIGFFITTLYYRMNLFGKLAVSIGVPALLFVILPIVESLYPTLNFFSMIINAFVWIMGFGNGTLNPIRAIACFIVGSGLVLSFSYLLMRRATVKDA